MGYVTVKFLGEEYQVSEAINEFLHYDELLTPTRIKILQRLSQDIKKDSLQLTFGDHIPDYITRTVKTYQNLMLECVEVLVNKMFTMGIYDVTANDLLNKTTTISDLDQLGMDTMQTMLAEGRKYVNMKERGMEQAYRSAASNITGSGVILFTSSITRLMIHSVVERGILMSQAKKADQEYEAAVKALSISTRNALDKMTSEVVVKQFYPSIMDKLMDFNHKITSAFLVELVQHNKFDFASVQKYDMQKAEQMLPNINRVPDKAAFLRQIFNVCPYSLELYEMCLNQGLLDMETFNTAQYFGFADNLVEKMDGFIKQNLQNKNRIAPVVSILATHKNISEAAVWRSLYRGTTDNIENTYRKFNLLIANQSNIGGFIKEKISSNVSDIVRKSQEDVSAVIGRVVSSVVSENNYSDFVAMGLVLPENIRIAGSTATELNAINSEITNALVNTIMAHIEETKYRISIYQDSKAKFDSQIQAMKKDLDELKAERDQLGFFAFSKKKEIAAQIENKERQLSEFERTHESKKLWDDVEKLYR